MLGNVHLKGNRGLGDPAMQHPTCVAAIWEESNGMEVNLVQWMIVKVLYNIHIRFNFVDPSFGIIATLKH